MRRSVSWLVGGTTVALAAVVVVASIHLGFFQAPAVAVPRGGPPSFEVQNETSELGATFEHGAPQAFGYNGSVVLLTGVVGAPVNSTVPFALLGALGGVPSPGPAPNLSAEIAGEFPGGDTLGIGWNGTAWLIAGEAAWRGYSGGAVVALSDGRWTNLTGVVGPYFSGAGGIWFVAWNGTSWLLGGASGRGAALVSLHGSTVHDLTELLPNRGPNTWIQFLAWNGTGWLVGGYGVFGELSAGRYTDLFASSMFGGGGMYAADWNGSAWLVGGGTPGTIEYLYGSQLVPGPTLAATFSMWVSTIVWDGDGWFIGVAGAKPTHLHTAELEYLESETGALLDLSTRLPGAFSGGQVQYGALAPFLGPGAVLLIGQGGLGTPGKAAGPSEGAASSIKRASGTG
ncbi:MAG: hypothetical protein L3J96_00100 [Thermoplasmata archaeon]|nr:hypothetical protein [Thermoplasmata archaeon]